MTSAADPDHVHQDFTNTDGTATGQMSTATTYTSTDATGDDLAASCTAHSSDTRDHICDQYTDRYVNGDYYC